MVQITSIQVIVDLLQVFGFEAFEIDHAQARPITMQQDSTCETPNDTTADDTTADNTITANPDDTELVTNASSNEEFASASNIILNVLMRLMDGEVILITYYSLLITINLRLRAFTSFFLRLHALVNSHKWRPS